ncbi:zinc finger protein 423-like isoform X2 [Vespula squamosa]|uniref:Zinc finger protein 423-like isoform X2 n=1 Tax=Vespula squamosa TaxID=30214 RepID=A0ABD2AIC7_VESSQ
MARAREYERILDAINTSLADRSTFNRQEILIKQEPFDNDDTDSYNTCMSTTKESEDIKLSLPEDDINWKENVCSQSESHHNVTAISNSPIKKKSVSMGHVENENRKCIQQEKDSFIIDENDENGKKLVKHNNIRRSNRKRKRNISTKIKRSLVYCDICSLPYDNLKHLQFHKSSYTKSSNYFCSSCVSHSCSHINNKMFKARYCCHFCERMFNKKKKLQSHLFHIHGKEIGINVEDNSFSINNSTVSYSDNLKKKRMRQKTMMEYIVHSDTGNEQKTSEDLNNSNVDSALTIVKEEIEWMDYQVDQSPTDETVANVSQTENSDENNIQDQPFVKIHVDSNMMKALLGISDDDNHLEKSSVYSSNINSNSITDSINSKPYLLRSLNNSIVNNSKPSTIVHKNDRSDRKVKKLLSMCKKCTVLLVKCDDKFLNGSTSNSSQFAETSSVKPVNRKLRERRSSHRINNSNKLSSKNSFPQTDISKDFIKNNSSVKSALVKIKKRVSNSKPNSSVTLNSKLSIKSKSSRKKRSDRRQSVLEQSLLDPKNKKSSKKAAITNPKSSSRKKKSDSIQLQNKQSANVIVGLKEVKVSLVKLPEIKKEVVVRKINKNATASTKNETFPCTICKRLLISKKHLKKHIRKCHTAYISSICRARYSSKRLLLKHYLQEHDTWVRKCCVCYQFFNSRLLLKQHLLLHCIKVTLSKNDYPLSNKNIKCYLNEKKHNTKRTPLKIKLRSQSTEHPKIDNNRAKPKEISKVSKIENLTNQVNESKENNDSVLGKVNDRPDQAVSVELTNPFKSNNTEVSPSRKNDLMEEPIPDGPYAASESIIYNSNEDQQIELISHTNLIQPSVSDNNEFILEIETTMILLTHINTTHNAAISSLYKLHCQFCNQGFYIEENLLIHELHYHANAVTINDRKVTDIWKVSNGETSQSLQMI